MNEPLRNTLLLVGQVELSSVPAGLVLALLLERTDLPGRRFTWLLLVGLLFLPLYVQAAAWDAGFGVQGWWAYRSEGSVSPWLAGMRGAVWIHSCVATPWATLLIAASLRMGSHAWEELARLDASPWRVLARVTLPRAAPGILAALLWIAVATVGEMTVTDMYQVRTYAEAIYLDLAAGIGLDELTWGAVGNGLMLVALSAGAAATAWVVSSPKSPPPRGTTWRYELGPWRWPLAIVVLSAVSLLWLVPLGNLLHNAGAEVRAEGNRRIRSWSAGAAVRQVVAARTEFAAEFQSTSLVGCGAATLALVAVLPCAWLARRSRWAIALGCVVTSWAWAVPGPMLSLWLLQVRDASPSDAVAWLFDDTLLVLIVVHAWRASPLVWLILLDALRSFPQAELEMAAVAGAGPWRQWFVLVLPRRRGALLAAWLAAWCISLAEVPTSLLVGPQGVTTLAVRTFQLVHTGVDDRLAGLALATILIGIGFAALAVWVGGWGAADESSSAGDL